VVVYGHGTAAASPADLAVTYADLITQDAGVADAIARAVHVRSATAAARLSAAVTPSTGIINVTYADPEAKRSWLGVWEAIHSVTGPKPKAAGVAPDALRIVREPGTSTKQGSRLPGGPVPIGVVLGLFLGIALFLAWERSDIRADDASSLERELGLPASTLPEHAHGNAVSALPHRWAELASKPSGANIVLVDATRGSSASNRGLSAAFANSTSELANTYIRAHVPGTSDEDDVEAMRADLAVLVVAKGERIAEVRRSIGFLRKLGVEPRWALLVG
jgi:hypothetical protein